MVRIAAFICSNLIWRKEKLNEGELVFYYLFYLEFVSWLLERRVSDTIVNEKTLVIANALTCFFKDYSSPFHISLLDKEQTREETRTNPSYSKLTYQSYRKEVVEGQLLSYIKDFVLRRRPVQGRVADTSIRRRSSEDSHGHRGEHDHGTPKTNGTPYVREVELEELIRLIKLEPSERRIALRE